MDKPQIDLAKFESYKDRELLKCARHPDLPLLIWNYTMQAEFDLVWDEVTLQARALVTDEEGVIVGRAFNKFFNDDERRHTTTEDWVMYEKLDGSLGVLFYYQDAWRFASKGSFASPQVFSSARA